jgi:hypothetical protein
MNPGLMGIHWPNLCVLNYVTLHPTVGQFWKSSALLMAFIGTVFILRQRRYGAEGILAIAMFAGYFIFMSGNYQWWGGYAIGLRTSFLCPPFFEFCP